MKRNTNLLTLSMAAVLAGSLLLGGCHKKVAAARPVQPAVAQEKPVATPAARPVEQPAQVAEKRAPERPRYPDAATRAKIDELLARIQDAYFDYDQHALRADALSALQADAKTLADIIKDYPDFKLVVEGYCDERGSQEYNLALGDARARKAKDYLVSLGLPASQMNVVSYGKEKQVCEEHDESCWQKNRRAHLTTADARVHQ